MKRCYHPRALASRRQSNKLSFRLLHPDNTDAANAHIATLGEMHSELGTSEAKERVKNFV
jgi:hypothetical protein